MASAQSRKKTLPVVRWLGLHRLTLAVTALLILAALLRLYRLTDHGLWVDEIFTALFSSPDKSLVEVAQGPLNSPLATPPLWFFISHAFMKLFGTGDTAVRLPSLVAGALGVLVIYILGAALFGRRVGLVAALLLALSPAHLFVSREARFYAAIILFSMLTIYCLHTALTSGRNRWWAGFAVATLCNLYTHLTAFFVLAAEAAFVCMLMLHHWYSFRGKRDQDHETGSPLLPSATCRAFPPPFRTFLASLAVIGLCYLPMTGYLVSGTFGERGLGSLDTTQGFDLSLNYFLSLLSSFGA